jgi:lysophospholipase-3
LPWRKKFIKHLFLISPVAPTGFALAVTNLAAGPYVFPIATVPPMELRALWRTFASSLLGIPSTVAFGHKPIVITKHRNYSAYHMEDLLLALGFSVDQAVRLPRMQLAVEAPLVPTTYITGRGVDTPEQLVFWEGDFDVAPENLYSDGDGTVNLASIVAFGEELRRQQEQNNVHFKSVAIANATHSDIVIQRHFLRKVMAEILQANR